MVIAGAELCRPGVITIPTNGLLTKRILDRVDQICAAAPHSQIGINLSLDGIGEEHDEIRNVPGNWERAMETWQGLKELQARHKNLVLSVHTVVSKFNTHRIRDIVEGLEFLEPDSYITEVAEERVELDTVGWDITPAPEEYAPIADYLSARARQRCPRRTLVRLPEGTGPLHAGLPGPVLPAGQADPAGAEAGHPLPGRLGQRTHRAQRRRMDLLHPRRAGRQSARDEL